MKEVRPNLKKSMLYELLYDHVLYHVDAMKTHGMGKAVLEQIGKSKGLGDWVSGKYEVDDPILETELWGRKLKNPCGIAAGLDKTGRCFDGISHFGVGFIEAGTITERRWDGNKDQYILRFPGGLINNLGFPNPGYDEAERNLENRKRRDVWLALNIGTTPSTETMRLADYELYDMAYKAIKRFNGKLLYLAPNFYCPNVHGVNFGDPENLCRGVSAVTRGRLRAKNGNPELPTTPIMVKLPPDLEMIQLYECIEAAISGGADGFIVTNTSKARTGLPARFQNIKGGMSGKYLEDMATEAVAWVHEKVPDKPIIGLGGIRDAEGAMKKINSGAVLVQVLTGWVQKANLIKEVNLRVASERRLKVTEGLRDKSYRRQSLDLGRSLVLE